MQTGAVKHSLWQDSVDNWRADYGEDVELSFAPQVPDELIDAVASAFNLIREKLEEEIKAGNGGRHYIELLAEAGEALAKVQAERGQQDISHMSSALDASSNLHAIAAEVGA